MTNQNSGTLTREDYIRYLADKAYRTLDHDPNILLSRDGGPVGKTAHVVWARLIGLEDEIVDEFEMNRPVPAVWLTPILPTVRWMMTDDPPSYEPLRTATYRLQDGYATMTEAASVQYNPTWFDHDEEFLTRFLFVRYRRRL